MTTISSNWPPRMRSNQEVGTYTSAPSLSTKRWRLKMKTFEPLMNTDQHGFGRMGTGSAWGDTTTLIRTEGVCGHSLCLRKGV